MASNLNIKICAIVMLSICSIGVNVSHAQTSGVKPDDRVEASDEKFFSEEENIMIEARREVLSSYKTVALRPSIPSLLFLPGEHKLLQAAKANFLARIPSDAELNGDTENGVSKTSIRTVSLDGILYNGKDNWVIWINNQRITPSAIPSEVIDLKVYNEYISVKWFDVQTNKVFPIRIRPNQTFNLDARMFLPG